ncbi:MAG: DNA methyltransferase [Bacteroidetes bacterium]|nr:MAG: DNA methyltransferase [Bacteroidota bacterium]
MIDAYVQSIASITKQGDAREESYYSALAELLKQFAESANHKNIRVTVLPKKTEAGNPDFRVWDGSHSQIGYIEAKAPQTNLDIVESGDQIKRYLSAFPNLILTNFYEFRLYRNGKAVSSVLLARPFIPSRLKTVPPPEHIDEFLSLLEKFFQFTLPTVFTAESLASELATRTRFLRDQIIKEELREGSAPGAKKIVAFYEAFQHHLIANLKQDEFADLYAQTITYGMFAARTRANGEFNRKLAYDLIPKTIGILRDIFHFISFDPPEQLQATVDDIAEVLSVADVKNILHQYSKGGKGRDPIFHFYETFLAEYNPRERERRGVYYTPEPVVSYIIRSLDIILRETFKRKDGFATHSVTVLDPAGGTLTFLAEAAKLAVENFVQKYGEGSKSTFIEDHILKHFYAFEIMMAPYAAGHLKIGYLLEELGHKLTGEERFQFFLTNTLEMEELAQASFPGMASLSEESHRAGEIKKEKPILVIVGNPPYSGHSTNKGDWILNQIENYKMVDGSPLGEKNPKWLQDDYVKFIRFAQWKIEGVGEGVLSFITNHSYLDNPTFRGMRQSLMNTFDDIYLLDLHGNSLRKETSPDGSADENVFDIQQGVCIAIFVKQRNARRKKSVIHAELWGKQDAKYHWLQKHNHKKTKWRVLKPSSPFYFFVPRNERRLKKYNSFPSVQQIFPLNSVGIVTARDHFTIDFDEASLKKRIKLFMDSSLDDAFIAHALGLTNTSAWNISQARDELKTSTDINRYYTKILYRPFDTRTLFYHHSVIERGRQDVMQHLLKENLALIVPKRVETAIPWGHVLVSDTIVEHVTVSLKTIDYCFPLYVYPEPVHTQSGTLRRHISFQAAFLFEPQSAYSVRKPNFAAALLPALKEAYRKQPTPEQVFNYLYAILYSNAYRKKYAEFLKTDFPRVPFTNDYKLFLKLNESGEQLVQLHLLQSKNLERPLIKCEGAGILQVAKILFDEKKQRVFINAEQYFSGVSKQVWEYRVGGYQVAEKWLKDRKGRTLSSEDVVTYSQALSAIAETINIQKTLDALYEKVETDLIEITL